MNKLKLLAGLALCLAYASGIATGWAGYTLAGETPPPPKDRGSWLSHELGLTAEQARQIEAIWSNKDLGPEGDERARVRALYDERKERVRQMLLEDQQEAFDEIYREFDARRDAIFDERKQRHEKAIADTMAILDPEQQVKYKAIVEDFENRNAKRDRGTPPWRAGD